MKMPWSRSISAGDAAVAQGRACTARACAAAVLVLGLLGCSGEERLTPLSGKGGSTATGGAGGSVGGAASGGSAGTDGAAAGGSAGATADAGSDAEPDGAAGGASSLDAGAIDTACTGNKAFVANGAAYVFPTPPALAGALSGLGYEASAHPLTVVLAVKGDGTAVTAASASVVAEGGTAHSFPDSMKPDLAPATVKAGGFGATSQQKDAWLVITDSSGDKYVKLENVAFSASTSSGCSTALFALTAVIPASESGVPIELPTESTTLGKLAGPSKGGSWDLKVLFTAASTDFDFGST
ncbi:MAG: hypothetical protein HYZ29_24975 [Myxococcales bacterium]|nr:hypothetical protein [Myxococcales bacterium]